MKSTLILILLASLLTAPWAALADDIPAGTLNLQNVAASDVLNMYKQLSGLELVVDSRARKVTTEVTFRTTTPLKREEALKLIQGALLKQAGIVVTPLDDKRVSVTYNDALPIGK